MSDQSNIRSVLKETRRFPPPAAFQSRAAIQSMDEYERLWSFSAEDPERFWSEQAESLLSWTKKWTTVLDWQLPHAKWFVGGKLNASYNCVDRHAATWRKNKAAILWEGEPGDSRTITYGDLHRDVQRFANVLLAQGIKAGDRVTIYMPLVPEIAVAMLACARIGAMHNVVFGGFSADAVADRNNDAKARLVITADGGYRKGGTVALKASIDDALLRSPTVETCIVLKRTGEPVTMKAGRGSADICTNPHTTLMLLNIL